VLALQRGNSEGGLETDRKTGCAICCIGQNDCTPRDKINIYNNKETIFRGNLQVDDRCMLPNYIMEATFM